MARCISGAAAIGVLDLAADGVVPVEAPDAGIETKYNHWHDERDGRFTTSGAGRHVGSWQGGGFTGGGGGSGDGGGASASWGRSIVHAANPPAVRSARPAPVAESRAQAVIPSLASAAPRATASVSGSGRRTANTAAGAHVEVRNGYLFRIDGEGRTEQVSGAITLGTSRRSRTAQAAAGGPDRLRGDGGHYIAVRFKGPTEAFNHFAQDANFNRGAYRALEDAWARDVRGGKSVTVTITPSYVGHSKRPDTIRVLYTVSGSRRQEKFANERQKGKRHG